MGDRRIFALTLIQPWAELIVRGPKRVENRTWAPRGLRVGDYLALHAGVWHTRQGGPIEAWVGAMELARDAGLLPSIPLLADYHRLATGERGRCYEARCKAYLERAVPYGAVVGVARLAAIETTTPPGDPWWCGPVGWRLGDVVAFAQPVTCRGAQGLWTLPPEVLAGVKRGWRQATHA